MPTTETQLSRRYAKLCDRRDFDDVELRGTLRDVVPGHERDRELERKYWEYAMLALFMRDVGALHDDAEVLAVGAGHEAPLFWLANRVGRIVATDIYGEGSFSDHEAADSMLDDPARFAPYPYREDRLEVRWMDARRLQFPDSSFDCVFTLSSIEHFGSLNEIASAAAEIGRVVKPGGHAFVVTECFTSRHFLDIPAVQAGIRVVTGGRRCSTATLRNRIVDVFTPSELHRWILRPSRLHLMQELDMSVSVETFQNTARWVGPGQLEPATGKWNPHIVLRAHGSPWTSVCLPLEKA